MWKKRNCTIIIDESFLEFEDLTSLSKNINSYEKLYIIKSFTKFHSCAGVRIGAIFSHQKNIKQFQIPLWNLSSFDAEFLTSRLSDTSFDKKSKKLHKVHKKELYKTLKNSKLFSKIYKSDSNFFLVKSKNAQEIFRHLLKNKILTRPCQSFDFLNNHYLRFGVKNTSMHKSLKECLQNIPY